jgi:hypothetical protein
MAVLSIRELAGRTLQHRFGEPPTAQMQFALTLDDPNTPHQQMYNAVGIFHGSPHPEYVYLRCIEGTIAENDPDPWHATITYSFELPQLGTQEEGSFDPNPLSRRDVWSFSTGGSQVPALIYYEGSGNSNVQPLVNGAGDFFENLTTTESEVRATIAGNRASFPLATAAAITNAVNDAPYLGGATHTWLCAGISAQQASEVVNDTEVNYWQISVQLIYRQSGWPLLLPHVGWNYLVTAGGEKRATYVIDPEDGVTKITSSTPQPLNSDGTLKYAGAGGAPDLLVRRLHPEVDFTQYFVPPTFG